MSDAPGPKYSVTAVVLILGTDQTFNQSGKFQLISAIEKMFDANGPDKVGPGGAMLQELILEVGSTTEAISSIRERYSLVGNDDSNSEA